MATGPARQDIEPDAEPFLDTANDQPAETSGSNRSQRERSEGHHFGPENETDSQRNGDLANSQDQQISDKEVSDYFPLLPPELKEGVIHILIINADEDKKMAKQLKTELKTEVKLLEKGSIKIELNVKLFNEIMGDTIEQTNNAYEMSVFIFLLVTDSFVKDNCLVLKSHSYLIESFKKDPKKWCVIPIDTATKMKDKLPIELRHLRSYNYWQGNESDFFEDINKLLNNYSGSVLHCERQVAEKRKCYCRENRPRLKKDFEHFKSSSSPSLCENFSGRTPAGCEQNLPQNPQQMEPMLGNPSSPGLPPHAYSCPANLSIISKNRQPITERVPQTATWQNPSSPHFQNEAQHPHLPGSGVTASNPASSVAEQLGANRCTDISTDGAKSIDEPRGSSGANAINDNLEQMNITGDHSNSTPVGDDRVSDNDSGCIEVIPTPAADEAAAEISEPSSRDSIGILISRSRVEPEEDNSEDQDELHQISSLKF